MSKVELLVYDLSNGLARQMSQAILGQAIDGIWHTGVLVYGYEYFFGGGIQKLSKGQFTFQNGLSPVRVVPLGTTSITQEIFEQYLSTIRAQYTAETYDLLTHNCNNFSNEIANFLLGVGIPSYIIDLPRTVLSTPGGAMLRPLIEGMQGNIRSQNGNGLDPFGHPNIEYRPLEAETVFHEQSLSQSITQSLQDPNLISSSQHRDLIVPPLPPSLVEERPLVFLERDSKPIQAMMNKILSFSDPLTSQPILSESQRILLEKTVCELINSSIPLQNLQFPNEAFLLLGNLLNLHPSLEMACLFLMRLLILIPNHIDHQAITPILQIIIQRISLSVQKSSSPSASPLREFTASQLVLAVCVVANCISHHAGCLLLFAAPSPDEGTNLSSGEMILSLCIDASMWGMCHERSDLRQVCGALAYNITLASTKWEQESTAGVQLTWRSLHVASAYHPQQTQEEESSGKEKQEENAAAVDDDGDDDVHPHVVQLLCGSLDNIDGENDPVSFRRRILTAYRVTRSGGENVKNLAIDLGYDTVICEIRKREAAASAATPGNGAKAPLFRSEEDHHLIVHLENYFRS